MSTSTPCPCDTSICKNESYSRTGIFNYLHTLMERIIKRPGKIYLDSISTLSPEYLCKYK